MPSPSKSPPHSTALDEADMKPQHHDLTSSAAASSGEAVQAPAEEHTGMSRSQAMMQQFLAKHAAQSQAAVPPTPAVPPTAAEPVAPERPDTDNDATLDSASAAAAKQLLSKQPAASSAASPSPAERTPFRSAALGSPGSSSPGVFLLLLLTSEYI